MEGLILNQIENEHYQLDGPFCLRSSETTEKEEKEEEEKEVSVKKED